MPKHQTMENKSNHKFRVIKIILLATIAISSLIALIMLPYKFFSSALLAISILGLIVYYIFGNNQSVREVERKNYSDILIVEELEDFFANKEPYLNPNFTISDLEKQLKVSHSAISSYTKKKYRRNFNQFVNLWRIAEVRRLQSLLENEDISLNKLCVKAGFNNTQQYFLAEKERKALNMKKGKSELIRKTHDDKVNDLDVIKKPEINMRV